MPGSLTISSERSIRRGVVAGFCCSILFTFLPSNQHAKSDQLPVVNEYAVKAAFIYNFTKFIEWPEESFPSSDAPLIIGLLGKDPFGAILDDTINGQSVKGRRLEVKRFGGLNEIEKCHLLFVSRSFRRRLSIVFDRLIDDCVLTVGEIDGFANEGGIVNFVMEEDRVRFEINFAVAEGAGLRIQLETAKSG